MTATTLLAESLIVIDRNAAGLKQISRDPCQTFTEHKILIISLFSHRFVSWRNALP